MKTVFVGLSGGVDSAVSAYLLKEQGYRVVGAFVRVWEPSWLSCTSREDRLSAMRVAAHLGIPFVTYDLAEVYKREVVDAFVAEYRAGRTPNPDVLCNRAIKFGALWDRARADGADAIATGHYAQNKHGSLYRGADPTKDQAYFLWMLTKMDLEHILFPVGGMQKSMVRSIARRARLPNAGRRDSQGLCFLGHVDMKEFLARELGVERDDPRLYTLGERVHGAYVVDKGMNELALAPTVAGAGRTMYTLEKMNWINSAPDPTVHYEGEVRYHGEQHTLTMVENTVAFEHEVLVAPGQSLVVYDPKTAEVKGGGIII